MGLTAITTRAIETAIAATSTVQQRHTIRTSDQQFFSARPPSADRDRRNDRHRVVQAFVDQIINMIPVWNRLMAAVWTMSMRRTVSGSAMVWVAPVRIGRANFDHVFISVPDALNVLQAAAVEIIDVVLVLNGYVPAARTVHMHLIGGRQGSSFPNCSTSTTHDWPCMRRD